VEAVSRAVALEPEAYLILRATLHDRHDQLEPAAADLRELVRLTPGDWEAWRFLGDVLMGLERYAEAEQALDEALALGPVNGRDHTYRLRSKVRRAREDFAGALEDIAACAQAAGGWKLDQIATRAALLVELERWREAAAAYREALELYPGSVSYAFNLYRLELELGNDEAALGYLDRAYTRSQERGATPQLKRLIEETWLEVHHR